MRSEGFMSMKNPMTPAGIEPASFRFVAQLLNHCATAIPVKETRDKSYRGEFQVSFHTPKKKVGAV